MKAQGCFLVVSIVAFGSVLGIVARERTARALPSTTDVALVWSASSNERMAMAGIGRLYENMDKTIAPVISDAQTRVAVIQWLSASTREAHDALQALEEDAAMRHGLPRGSHVHFSAETVAWVTTG